MHKLKKIWLHVHHPHRLAAIETTVSVIACFAILTGQAAAVIRFTDRSLMVNNASPGATTSYTLSFQYTTATSIGSLSVVFCLDPIPYDPCVPPTGLNVSNATLTSQTGETGYSITQKTANSFVLSRNPSVVTPGVQSTYVISGIVNPSETVNSFAARLDDYASTNGTGTIVDLGSVETQITSAVELETQVPPMLIFCAGEQVAENCSSTTDNDFADLGNLSPLDTLTSQSQMAAGTNASRGYAITANGTTMEAGDSEIASPSTPTASIPGTNEFGINLVANSNPDIGQDPDLPTDNAQPTSNYGQPNKYMFQNGDVVAQTPDVSLVQRYTISYVVNSSASLRAGVYDTTITYICTGRF